VSTHYSALGVSETATQTEIKRAYRALLKKIHPDTVVTLSPELRRIAEGVTREIVEAYSVLSDPNRRSEYDRELAERRRESRSSQTAPSSPRGQAVSTRASGVPDARTRRSLNNPTKAVILLVLLALLAYWIFELSHEVEDLLN
jgi:curved DNA-binding protein CbpA